MQLFKTSFTANNSHTIYNYKTVFTVLGGLWLEPEQEEEKPGNRDSRHEVTRHEEVTRHPFNTTHSKDALLLCHIS